MEHSREDGASFLQLTGAPREEFEGFKLFFPHFVRRAEEMHRSGRRFVHYTTAENEIRILTGQTVWMRKTRVMNDFMEFQHGVRCLDQALSSDLVERLRKALSPYGENPVDRAIHKFRSWMPHLEADTYITSISEHLSGEDRLGRLSMWRAYGGKAGVALVLKSTPFFRWSQDIGVSTSPVTYLSVDDFPSEFHSFVTGIEKGGELLRYMQPESIVSNLFAAFRFAALCTKHPGFVEEQEWRLVHSPLLDPVGFVTNQVETVRGIPQNVVKIPLDRIGGVLPVQLPDLLERIIIGPAEYPGEIRQAFVMQLSDLGFGEPQERVHVSTIPLRIHD